MRTSLLLLLLCVLTACGDERPQSPASGTTLEGLDAAALETLVRAFNQGVGQMDRFEPEQALPHFEQVAAIAPRWSTAHLNLGIALLNAEKSELYPRAEQELRLAMRLDPDDPRPPYSLGMLLQHLARYAEARTVFERVLALDPDDADTHFQLGSLLMDDDPKEAREHLTIAYELKPHSENACYRLFQLLREAGEMEAAQKLIERFRALKQTGAGEPAAIKYGEMGRYADVVRSFGLPAPIDPESAPPRFTDAATARGLALTGSGTPGWPGAEPASYGPGVATADIDGDGDLDLYVASLAAGAKGRMFLNQDGKFVPLSAGVDAADVIGACFGDYDRDGDPDLFLTRRGANALYANEAGRFRDVTREAGVGGPDRLSVGAAFADADHDGDLDLYVANAAERGADGAWTRGAPNALWRNNGQGHFEEVAASSGIDGGRAPTLGVSFFDADGDRDLDLYLINDGTPNELFLNDRVGVYRKAGPGFDSLRDAGHGLGAVIADVDGNGLQDVLLIRGADAPRLLLQVARARFEPDPRFIRAVADTPRATGALLADADLDGDVDLLLIDSGRDALQHQLLRNNGRGEFGPPIAIGPAHAKPTARGALAVDFNGDGALAVLVARATGAVELWTAPRPAGRHWLEIVPGRTAEDAKGPAPGRIGLTLEVKTGQRAQTAEIHTQSGYLGGTPARLHFGLGRAPKADYIRLTWPDAVLQSELEVSADQRFAVAKVERKPSSCPLLFSWDGTRFAYVTDFLGVGGCGFFIEPGVYAPPDPTEAVRIPPAKIRPRAGRYLLRVAEPLEEVTYLDQLELRVYDHPSTVTLYPDERFAAAEPFPTAEPRTVATRIFPVHAIDDRGNDVTKRLRAVDRRYVEPPVDPRFVGYARPHTLELDFRGRVPRVPEGGRLVLFLHGWVEYTYSHVNFAAWQAGLVMQSPRLEIPDGQGGWKTAREDMGFPAGLPRMMTVDVTDILTAANGRMRIRSNMELFWDQAFLGVDTGRAGVVEHRLSASRADVRFLGYPREFSPDGGVPTEYDYGRIDPGLPYKLMAGAYTRFGDVRPLLEKTDDQFVIFGRGEEIVLEFDASKLPKLGPGRTRTVVLYADGYCKDMDLYTAYPDTVGPLPFHGMSTYPPLEPPPADDGWKRIWNTRRVRTR